MRGSLLIGFFETLFLIGRKRKRIKALFSRQKIRKINLWKNGQLKPLLDFMLTGLPTPLASLTKKILLLTKVGFQSCSLSLFGRYCLVLTNQTPEHQSENPIKLCPRFMLSLSKMTPNAFSSHVTTANQKPILRLMTMEEFTSFRVVKQVVQSLIFHDPGLKSTKWIPRHVFKLKSRWPTYAWSLDLIGRERKGSVWWRSIWKLF